MSERDVLFLQHMLGAIDDIQQFTAEGKAAFLTGRKTQSAVVRHSSHCSHVLHAGTRRVTVKTTVADDSRTGCRTPLQKYVGVIDFHVFFKLARAHSDEGHSVPVCRVHISLYFKNKSRKFIIVRLNTALTVASAVR